MREQMKSVTQVKTDGAPAAIGPYSQAVVHGGIIYTAGQIALDPATGQVVDGDVTRQTERVFLNLRAVLDEAGGSFQTILKTTVFLRDMNDFAAMNDVYSRFMGDHRPARSTVQVARLPRDVAVEIEVVAVKNE